MCSAARAAKLRKRPAAAQAGTLVVGARAEAASSSGSSMVPKVPDGVVAELRGARLEPFRLRPLQPLLRELAIKASGESGKLADCDAAQVCKHFLDSSPKCGFRVSTKAAMSASLGLDRRKISSHLYQLAGAIVHHSRDARFCIEAQLASCLDPQDCLLCVDATQNDETPLRVGIHEQPSALAAPASSSTRAARSASTDAVAVVPTRVSLPALPVLVRKEKTTVKILQSRDSWGLLFRAPGGRLVSCYGWTHSWLQLLDRTTAECLSEAARQRSSITTEFCNRFQAKTRMLTLDGALSNERAERSFKKDLEALSSGWTRLNIACEAHFCAGSHKKTFHLVDSLISGQLHWALALNEGTAFLRFTRILKQVVKRRIAFRYPDR